MGISLRVKCSPKALQHHNSSNNPQDEGLHCSASHTGHGSARLLAQVADTSWNRRGSIDSCCARRASMESAFRASYCVLPGWNESYEGSSGGEGARTHVQVLANSGVASILTLLHAYQLYKRNDGVLPRSSTDCYSWPGDLLVVGIVANYAAVAADTFSSELGILSKSKPRLITSWNLREVPPGTNGGVTLHGLASGFLGSLVIVAASVALIPFCGPKVGGWGLNARNRFAFAMAIWGALGSVLDSLL